MSSQIIQPKNKDHILKVGKSIRSLLEYHEGYREKLYKCTAGKLTIGIGHNVESNGFTVPILKQILKDRNNYSWYQDIDFDKFLIEKGRLNYSIEIARDGLTKDQVYMVLESDINMMKKDLSIYPWFNALKDGDYKKNVCLDMIFALGITRFKKFVRFISGMNDKNYDLAYRSLLDSLWARSKAKERVIELGFLLLKE